jgi:hypothetical protein
MLSGTPRNLSIVLARILSFGLTRMSAVTPGALSPDNAFQRPQSGRNLSVPTQPIILRGQTHPMANKRGKNP